MKNFAVLFCFTLFTIEVIAQSPDSFSYQAVIRDAAGVVMVNQPVGVQVSILQGTLPGTGVYTETFSLSSNGVGVITLAVGNGTVQNGSLSSIDWANGPYYLNVSIDITGGSTYTDMGTVQLLSVPYALYAKNAANGFSGNYSDLTNAPDFTGWDNNAADDFSGNYIDLTNKPVLGGDVTGTFEVNTVEKIRGMEISSNTPANGQVLKWNNASLIWEPSDDQLGAAGTTDGVVTGAAFTGTNTKTLTLIRSNGLGDITAVFTDLVDDADADPANEIQTLSVTGNDLSISSGNTVTLPVNSYTAGTGINISGNQVINIAPDQTVTLTGTGATTISGTYPDFTISSTDNNTSYSAGTGININGSSQIVNTAPDQTVILQSGSGIIVTGTYPMFNIANNNPDQVVTLTGTGSTTITGTYPNFTVSSTDDNTTYSAGAGINLNGTEIVNASPDQTVVLQPGAGISVTGTYPSFNIANSNPDQVVTITGAGSAAVTGTYPNFTITGTDNSTTYTAGTGLTLSGTTFSHNAHTGDASGTTNLTVTGIQGRSVSSTAPVTGQVFKYNGTSWVPSADDNTTYTAGTGINLAGTQIVNAAPDQIVSLTPGTGISVTGTYPNFSILNTTPDQPVVLTGGGTTTITGTYPNFTISSTDANTTYTAGTGLALTGTQFSHTAHTGDVSGTTTLTVTGMQGRSISTSIPANGQVLKWNSTTSKWEPNDDALGAVGTNDGVVTSANVTGTTTKTITLTRSEGLGDITATFTDAGSVYTAGTGIDVTGTTITNTAPDQTVALTGSGSTTISGTYPNFTISSTDNNTTYSAGTGLSLSGTTFNSTQTLNQTLTNGNSAGSNSIDMNSQNITNASILGLRYNNAAYLDMYYGHIYDYAGSHGVNGQVLTVHGTSPNTYVLWENPSNLFSEGSGISIIGGTISNTLPDQTVTLTGGGSTSISGSYPNFTISSTDNNTTYSAGTGLTLSGTTFSHPSHSGDVSGSTALTVTGLQGRTVSSTLPTSGQVLKYDGTGWVPSSDNAGTGTVTSIATGNGITGGTITTTGTLGLTGQSLALHNLATNGLITRTSSGTIAARTITAGNGISITNGDGVSGNPTIAASFGTTATTVAAGNHTHASYGAAGLTGYIQFNNSGSFGGSSELFWDNTNARMGVGLTDPNGRMVIKGSSSAPATEPLFEIKDDEGQTVFVVYKDSVRIFFNDDPAKTNKGTFAVSGRNSAKAFTNNYLLIRPDSSRIYTADSLSGFGVENVGSIGSQSYMKLTPRNYFIGHEAGNSIVSGRYNSLIGFQSGANIIGGSYNLFLGYRTGYASTWTNYCTVMGYLAGENNTSSDNTLIGYKAGNMHQGGGGNVFLGSKTGQNDVNGSQNVYIGEEAGFNNLSGQKNIYIGVASGHSNTLGSFNLFLGNEAGYANTTGQNNIFLGYQSGLANTQGENNIFIGNSAGKSNVGVGAFTGDYNTFIGYSSGMSNTDGVSNVFIGDLSGTANQTGNYNVYIGKNSGGQANSGNNVCVGAQTKANGNNNVMLGTNAGNMNTGSGNLFIGSGAGTSVGVSNRLIIENSSDITNPMIEGDFSNNRIAFHRTASTYPLQVGTTFTNGNGAFLTAGGVWTAGSSRAIKDRYTALDGQSILNKIENMELKGWFYKGTEEYHIGPFAEDFYQAFGTGDQNVKEDLGKYLSATDVSGVAMVAIQEMIKEINSLKKSNEELKLLIQAQQKQLELLK
ncbi:MAG: hypothetical protein CVU05_03070 [Bacteroidetes bacterium HGW-Bacteroidetes-21]|nr:MAG: hypothetical protein CVU05_03070 [Bacteroidetes bacterium HGW-Bacteroidetes-21]